MYDPEQITYFGETDFRNQRKKFGIKAKDRVRHMYVIGKTGMGKSTMLENMAVQDIQNGNGIAFIDPHGGSAEKLLEYVPEDRVEDVIYFAPFDMNHPISFNIMEDVGYDKRHLVVSGLMSAFEKIWADAWSARMAYILQNTLYALLEYPDSTLLDINRMLIDKDFRKLVVDNIGDPSIKAFWTEEFAKYSDRYTQDATPAIQNKIGQFVSNPVIRNIIGQPKSSFDVRDIMDNQKIMIMNLSKGQIGESNTNLLGSILITKLYLSAMSRADLSNTELAQKPSFYFYVDEFQSFANKSFADILSEARKYKLNLTIAHQYIEQMEEEVRSAVFGNVGTMVVFRVGSFDAEIFEKEFAPDFTAEDIVNLGYTQIYLKLMIDGISSKPFSATTLAPIEPPERPMTDQVIESSRKKYAQKREIVEEHIRNRMIESGVIKDEDKGADKNANKTEDKEGKGGSAPKKQPAKHSDSAPKHSAGDRQKPSHYRDQQKEEQHKKTQQPADQKETHQPFKDVLEKEVPNKQEEKRENQQDTSAPSDGSQQKHAPKKQKTDMNSQNREQLRAALAELVSEKPTEDNPQPTTNNQQQRASGERSQSSPSTTPVPEQSSLRGTAQAATGQAGSDDGGGAGRGLTSDEASDGTGTQHTDQDQQQSTPQASQGNSEQASSGGAGATTQQNQHKNDQKEVPEEVLRKTLE